MEVLSHVPLKVKAGESIRIAQVTDVHLFPAACRVWTNGRGQQVDLENYVQVNLLEAVLGRIEPHFVVLTGDILDGRPFRQMEDRDWKSAMLNFLEPLIRRGIPWTFVPGNHDDDDAPWSRGELLGIYQLPGCVAKGARSFNHTVTIGAEGTDSDSLRLWFFDSGGNHPDPQIRYHTFDSVAVSHFRRLAQELPDKRPGLAFFHIPLPEYGGLTPVHGTQQLFQAALRAGMVPRPWCWVPSLVRFLGYDRVVGSSKLNSGLFDALLDAGVLATFCGHDHASDAIFLREGLFLCYGRVSGTTPPSDWEGTAPLPFQPGIRFVAFSHGSFTTWVLGVLVALAVTSTAMDATSASCEDSSLVQRRKSKVSESVSSLEHAEEVLLQLRHMAMLATRATTTTPPNTSVPNYTVFRLDEEASEATLQMINSSMESFLDQVNTSFHNDLKEIDSFIQSAKDCNTDLVDQQSNLSLNVTSVNDNVVAAETQHDQCRVSENVTYRANLTAFNAFKSKLDFQLERADPTVSQEVPEVRCMRNYLFPGEPQATEDYTQPSEYSDAVSCAEEIKTWSTLFSTQISGGFGNYTSANQTHADKIVECNTLQGQYEQSFCSYRANLLHVCGELDRCFAHVEALYTATSELILQSNETRFRSFLVAKKVACYIDVLLRNLTIAAIYECDEKQYDTSELNFTFQSLPAKASCDVSLVAVAPCDAQWIQRYTQKSWYEMGAVEHAHCRPCGGTTTVTTTTMNTMHTVAIPVSTIVASTGALCAMPSMPAGSNLRCVGNPPELLGGTGSPAEVLLGTGRSAVNAFGTGTGSTLCAKMDNSVVKCWGQNDRGQLGLGDKDPRGENGQDMGDSLPALDFGGLEVLKMVIGRWHACALLDNLKIKCWGSNSQAQLAETAGLGATVGDDPEETVDQLGYVNFGPGVEVIDVAAGYFHNCAILKNTSVACWGYDGPSGGSGVLGRGPLESYRSPVPQVVDLGEEHAVHLAAGYYHTCALLNTSRVKCWGVNIYGQLGIGNTDSIGDDAYEMGVNLTSVPLNNVKHVSAGAYHNCAVLQDGSVTCWGRNQYGQSRPPGQFNGPDAYIGDVDGEVGPSPSFLIKDGSGNVNATEVVGGELWSCARLQNDNIYCWGLGLVASNYVELNS